MMEIALTSVDKITYKVDTIVLDAVIRENHSLKSRLTKHPIEEGSEITDHMDTEPFELELECEVTNTPVRKPGSHADGAEEIGQDIKYKTKGPFTLRLGPLGEIDPGASMKTAVVKSYSVEFDRVRNVWEELRSIVGVKVITVVTSLGDYENMAIRRVDAPRENSMASTLTFSMTLEQIRTVSSKNVQAPIPAEKIAVPKRRVGKAPPQPVTPTEEPLVESAASAAGESVLGSFVP